MRVYIYLTSVVISNLTHTHTHITFVWTLVLLRDKMKLLTVASFVSLALAAPSGLNERQAPPGGDQSTTVLNELTKGGCKGNILLFSRGTGEPANMVSVDSSPVYSEQ
jgi:hypothetical protein